MMPRMVPIWEQTADAMINPLKPSLRRLYVRAGSIARLGNLVPPRYRRAFILMYHRIVPTPEMTRDSPPSAALCVSAGTFEAQLRHLARTSRFVPLDDLFDHRGDSRPRIAVTLDDGYRDNLELALPILERLGIPATIYVTTRFPEGDTGMWWFELWERLQQGDPVHVRLGGWERRLELRDHADRRAAYWRLFTELRDRPQHGVEQIMGDLRAGEAPMTYPDLCLSWDDLSRLSRNRLVTLGAHGHRHLNLASESSEAVLDDIQRCTDLLRKHSSTPVTHFAYPYGARNARTVAAVESLGFRSGVTASCAPVPDGFGPELPRQAMTEQLGMREIDCIVSGWNAFWRRH